MYSGRSREHGTLTPGVHSIVHFVTFCDMSVKHNMLILAQRSKWSRPSLTITTKLDALSHWLWARNIEVTLPSLPQVHLFYRMSSIRNVCQFQSQILLWTRNCTSYTTSATKSVSTVTYYMQNLLANFDDKFSASYTYRIESFWCVGYTYPGEYFSRGEGRSKSCNCIPG